MLKPHEKERFIARIISGSLKWGDFLIKSPSPENIYLAQEIFSSMMEDGDGLSDEEFNEFIISEGLWSRKEQEEFERLPKDIEEWKVQIYLARSSGQNDQAKILRKYLETAVNKQNELWNKKVSFDAYGTEGNAQITKNKYLIATSIYKNNKRLIKSQDQFDLYSDEFINEACGYYNKNRISEGEIRELARTEPWRSVWIASKSEKSLFGRAASRYTDDQKAIVIWSGIYDSVYQHPDRPRDTLINEDDSLDGWMILQKRGEKVGSDGITNEKIKNADVILKPAMNIDEARNINALNSATALKKKEQRLNSMPVLTKEKEDEPAGQVG